MPNTREHPWWLDDPNVVGCPLCDCPIQGGPLAMSKHRQTVHRLVRRTPDKVPS